MEFEIFDRIKKECYDQNITLIAVSKTKSVEDIMKLYNRGQRFFGENRIQEWADKVTRLPDDIRWHLIGHIQTNKVKFLDPVPELIHSGDRISLFDALEKEGQKRDIEFNVLIQIKIAEEESKYGFSIPEIEGIAGTGQLDKYSHVRFKGVMGMATFTDNMEKVRREFQALRSCFSQIQRYFDPYEFCAISMGMSGDYEIAIEEGSTMVRIGSLIFGAR